MAGERRAWRPESEKARVSRGPDGRGERPARRLGLPLSLSVSPSGPSWPGGLQTAGLLPVGPVRAAPAYWGRTGVLGFREGGAHAARAGVAGERRATRPESEKARVSRRPDGRGERPARRLGLPLSLTGPASTRFKLRTATAGCSATGLRRCEPHRPTGAAPDYWGRGGLLGTRRSTPGADQIRILAACSTICSSGTRSPLLQPGQASAASAQARGDRRLESQNGQVRHCRGRTS